MKKVIIVDTYSKNAFHEMFNACFLKICDDLFDDIKYVISDSQKKCVLTLLKDSNITLNNKVSFIKCIVLDDSNKYLYIIKSLTASIFNLYYLIKSSRDTLIVFNINNPFFFALLSVIKPLIRKKKIAIINHGELEYLFSTIPYEMKSRFSTLTKIRGALLKMSFRCFRKSNKIFYIVLGDNIKNKLSQYCDVNPLQIVSMEHPYFFKLSEVSYSNIIPKQLSIGLVGGLNETKGLNYFIKLITEFRNNNITWHVVGKCSDSTLGNYDNVILHSDNKNQLERWYFNSLINKLDFIIYLYPETYYRMMASGAIYDAINFEKPIIALHNNYFDYLFQKYGAFGYMCDNIEEFESILKKILTKDIIDERNQFIKIMRQIKEEHSPLCIAKKIAKEINNI